MFFNMRKSCLTSTKYSVKVSFGKGRNILYLLRICGTNTSAAKITSCYQVANVPVLLFLRVLCLSGARKKSLLKRSSL